MTDEKWTKKLERWLSPEAAKKAAEILPKEGLEKLIEFSEEAEAKKVEKENPPVAWTIEQNMERLNSSTLEPESGEEKEECCGKGCCELDEDTEKVRNSTSYSFTEVKENKEVDLYNAATKLLPEVLSYYKTTLHSRESMISILERENNLLNEKVTLLAGKLNEYEQAAEEFLISKTIPAVPEAKELDMVDQLSFLFSETPSKKILEEQVKNLRNKNLRAINGESHSSFRKA